MPQASRARRDDSAPRCATHPGGRRRRAASRSRGCHLARCARVPPPVNAHGSHDTSLAPSETTSTRPCPTRHRCLIKNPSVESHLQVDFSLTNRHFSCAFPPRRCRRSFEAVPSPPSPASPRSTDRPRDARGPLPAEPRADAFDHLETRNEAIRRFEEALAGSRRRVGRRAPDRSRAAANSLGVGGRARGRRVR